MPVLLGNIRADALQELSGDPIRRLAHRAEGAARGLAWTGEHPLDRGAEEAAMAARGLKDVDLPVVSPAAQGVGIDAEDAARFAEREPERAGHGTSASEDG